MRREDAASLIACVGFVSWILTGINPGNVQPWLSIQGFRAEASHDGLALSSEQDAREYTAISPARDGWVQGDGQIRSLARFEDFPFTHMRPRAGILDLLLSTMGAGRPRFEFAAGKGGRFDATLLDHAFRVQKDVPLPDGAPPRGYLHVLAPAGTLMIHLNGRLVSRPSSGDAARDEVPQGARITIVSVLTGQGWRVERPPGSRAFLNRAAYQIELESGFERTGGRASSILTITPFGKGRG